jgi:hypothetical protein
MLIFIDESGNFARPSTPHRVSCVVALLIPETFAATLFRRFRRLIRPWRQGRGEVKGSELSETQMALVLALLRRFDVIAFADCIDMGLHTDAGIQAHKTDQGDALDRSAARVASPTLSGQIRDLANRVRALPNQLWAQAVVVTEVVDRVVRHGPLYYAQRIPSTLGAFRWRIDAKGIDVTPYERLWADIVKPVMQTKSLEVPTPSLIGADYSAFAPFEDVVSEPPAHLRDHLPAGERAGPFRFIDLNRMMADLRFRSSDRLAGPQLADMVASAITRACNGRIDRSGWSGLGRILLQNEKGRHALRFVALQDEVAGSQPAPYAAVVRSCDESAKRIVAGQAAEHRRR